MTDERRTRELYASYDGELSWWRRLLLRRRLARDPAARRELETVREIGARLREQAGEAVTPDLWAGIEARLPYAEAPAKAGASERTFGLGGAPGWAGAALATAGAALALFLFVASGPSEDPLAGSVQWLDSGGRATIVLQDDAEATIIWLLPETVRLEPTDGRVEHGRV